MSHECKDSCAPCLKCLEAAKTFAQLPAILRTMSATGGDSSQFFKVWSDPDVDFRYHWSPVNDRSLALHDP